MDAVIAAMERADTIVIGSPVYWHNLCGSVRNVLDFFCRQVGKSALSAEEISAIDRAPDGMDMSPVFGGTPVAKA
ncbi:MAG: NAD(P)H-dependent oxidoreductase [Aristaeellaceae bacterium]